MEELAKLISERTGLPATLDRYFKVSERGSNFAREVRGGLATFFAMAYIVVLNPLIIGTAPERIVMSVIWPT